jgi:hypothetical protein
MWQNFLALIEELRQSIIAHLSEPNSGRVKPGHTKLTDVELHRRQTALLDEIIISFSLILREFV